MLIVAKTPTDRGRGRRTGGADGPGIDLACRCSAPAIGCKRKPDVVGVAGALWLVADRNESRFEKGP